MKSYVAGYVQGEIGTRQQLGAWEGRSHRSMTVKEFLVKYF